MCLLERLTHLGPGARAAAERRQVTLRLEEKRRRERERGLFHGPHKTGRLKGREGICAISDH